MKVVSTIVFDSSLILYPFLAKQMYINNEKKHFFAYILEFSYEITNFLRSKYTIRNMDYLRFFVIRKKKNKLICFCSRLSVTLDKLLRLGIKNKRVYFVLLSTFRNFAQL